VGVLDKVAEVLAAVERGPLALAELSSATRLPRATAHRLAVALEAHGLLRRDAEGRFTLGLRLIGLGRAAADACPLGKAARPALQALRDHTGESVQLYVRSGDTRVCVVSLESAHGLRWIVPEGAVLPLDRGSAGRVLSAARRPPESSTIQNGETRDPDGWVESVEEREPGVASVSAPITGTDGDVVAAVSVSGPIERLTRRPGERYGAAVVAAARAVEAAVRGSTS